MQFHLIVAVVVIIYNETLRSDIVDYRAVFTGKLSEVGAATVNGYMAVLPDIRPENSQK